MMSIPDLVLELQRTKSPSRSLDVQIALVSGYRKISKVSVWVRPDGTQTRLPYFTTNLDAAQRLALLLTPDCIGVFTWGKIFSSARINDGPQINAASPSLALCAAALNATLAGPTKEPPTSI